MMRIRPRSTRSSRYGAAAPAGRRSGELDQDPVDRTHFLDVVSHLDLLLGTAPRRFLAGGGPIRHHLPRVIAPGPRILTALPGFEVLCTEDGHSLSVQSFRAVRHSPEVDDPGVANITAGLTQSFPMGNRNSRTAVNDEMGVLRRRRPVSIDEWRAIRAASRADFVIGVVAMLGVVVFGVLEGILVAVGLSIVHVVRRSARPHDAVLGWVPRLDRYADVKLHTSAQQVPGGGCVPPRRPPLLRQRRLRPGAGAGGPGGLPDGGAVLRVRRRGPRGGRQHGGGGGGDLSSTTSTSGGSGSLVARVKHPVREQLDRSGLTCPHRHRPLLRHRPR